jgi:hypothetical protein
MTDTNAFLKFLQEQDTIECGESFTVSVSHSMSVEDCGNYSDDEQQKMFRALRREINRKTEAVCAENVSCPFPSVTEVKELSNDCDDGVWTIEMEVTAKCES